MDQYIKGGLSGMFGVLISHPFDTIKSNIQNNIKPQYKFFNLYRGLIPPLFGTCIEKSIVFGTYTKLCSLNTDNKYYNYTINGFISGFLASFIITPYERLKIIKQNNVNIKNINIKSMNIKSLYSGFSMCILRDSPGFAIYFTNYEFLKHYFYTSNNLNISIYGSFIIGGSSGLISWIFIYPQDKIKTILQSNNTNLSITNIISNIHKSGGGLKSFYNGFSFALMRAIPLHAGTFMMFELLK